MAAFVIRWAQKVPLVIAGVPEVGQRFASDTDAIESYWRNVVPHLGRGISRKHITERRMRLTCNKRDCSYTLILVPVLSSKDWVVSGESCLKHIHGPAPQLLKDPKWRPPRYGDGQVDKVRRYRV